jgi:hypothetical protein
MGEIPQKGWYVHKDKGERTISGTKVYLDGKQVGGILKLSIEIDAERMLPVLRLEVIAHDGLVWDTSFGEFSCCPAGLPLETAVFRSSVAPEDVLGTLGKEGGKSET